MGDVELDAGPVEGLAHLDDPYPGRRWPAISPDLLAEFILGQDIVRFGWCGSGRRGSRRILAEQLPGAVGIARLDRADIGGDDSPWGRGISRHGVRPAEDHGEAAGQGEDGDSGYNQSGQPIDLTEPTHPHENNAPPGSKPVTALSRSDQVLSGAVPRKPFRNPRATCSAHADLAFSSSGR